MDLGCYTQASREHAGHAPLAQLAAGRAQASHAGSCWATRTTTLSTAPARKKERRGEEGREEGRRLTTATNGVASSDAGNDEGARQHGCACCAAWEKREEGGWWFWRERRRRALEWEIMAAVLRSRRVHDAVDLHSAMGRAGRWRPVP
jgi:hypothetical protein